LRGQSVKNSTLRKGNNLGISPAGFFLRIGHRESWTWRVGWKKCEKVVFSETLEPFCGCHHEKGGKKRKAFPLQTQGRTEIRKIGNPHITPKEFQERGKGLPFKGARKRKKPTVGEVDSVVSNGTFSERQEKGAAIQDQKREDSLRLAEKLGGDQGAAETIKELRFRSVWFVFEASAISQKGRTIKNKKKKKLKKKSEMGGQPEFLS